MTKPRATAASLLLALLLVPALNAQDRRVAPTAAPRRLALVIGNEQYAWSPLRNPVHDAEAIARSLQSVGFAPADITLARNTTLKQLQRASRDFLEKIRPGDVAFVYYSGHGMEVRGENYLIPVDFPKDATELAVADEAYSAQTLLRNLDSSGARVKVIVLDACRDNPLRSSRSGARGLGRMEGEGTLVVFATSAGRTADDNRAGQNGLFTTHLLRRLPTPGMPIDEMFKRVAQDVYRASGEQKQLPAIYGVLIEDFLLKPAGLNPANDAPLQQTLQFRTDGLYQAPGADPKSYHYLRFYADGAVVSVYSTATPVQAAQWISRTHEYSTKAQATFQGPNVSFTEVTTTSKLKNEGTLRGGQLYLKWTDLSDGKSAQYVYRFVPVVFP